ncbi:MAG: AAA family ATPase [Burkholderiales bacterium]|nr:AAA family ATPase [Burkholderiales bacterium]MDP2399184.1 AAA family ATPase [Burkholderiales bacterium]
MYYEHFGLSQAPFKITPNTDFFFGGGNRGPILEALIYAITQGEGIVKVTGEVGSGKTMLCSMLQARLTEHVETIYLANPSVSPEEILHAIAFELQLDVPRDATRLAVMHAIQEHLLKRHAEGKRVVLFVEESQGMPIATLEEIRLLSNLETKSDKLLQIVLFGQPELDDNLRENNIRQLKERITHSFRLEPLTTAETREYLMFRLRAAGYRGPDLFSDGIVREIARISGGLTRRINLITDKALLAAFSENTHSIRQKHIDAAVRDSEFARIERSAATGPRWAWGALLVLAGMAAGAAIFALLDSRHATAPAVTGPPATSATPQTPPAVSPTQAQAAPEEKQINDLKTNTYKEEAAAPANPATATVEAVQPAAEAPRATGSLLEARLAATEAWLDSANPKTHTIQLMGSSDDQQLNNHLRILSNLVEINSLFVYRTVAKGAPALNVVWGSFDSPGEAREAMAKLPPSLKAYRPLLRTVQGIKAEVRERKAP